MSGPGGGVRLATRREVARRRAPGCADEGVQGGQQEGRWRGMERGGLSVPGGAVFGAVAVITAVLTPLKRSAQKRSTTRKAYSSS